MVLQFWGHLLQVNRWSEKKWITGISGRTAAWRNGRRIEEKNSVIFSSACSAALVTQALTCFFSASPLWALHGLLTRPDTVGYISAKIQRDSQTHSKVKTLNTNVSKPIPIKYNCRSTYKHSYVSIQCVYSSFSHLSALLEQFLKSLKRLQLWVCVCHKLLSKTLPNYTPSHTQKYAQTRTHHSWMFVGCDLEGSNRDKQTTSGSCL